MVGGSAETELQELEVVVDAVEQVVEVLVVDERALDGAAPRLEPVGLRHQRVRRSVPRHVIAEEQTGDAHLGELVVGRVRVLDQVARLDAVAADEVAHTQPDEASELLEPTAVEHAAIRCGGWPAVLVLAVLAPHDERHSVLHGDAHWDGEDRDVLRP